MTCLVDSSIISELCRRQSDLGVLAWASTVTRYAVSVISVDAEQTTVSVLAEENGRLTLAQAPIEALSFKLLLTRYAVGLASRWVYRGDARVELRHAHLSR